MNPHFFTTPFYFAFLVQGSGLSWRLRRLFLEDGILVSQPSPLGNADDTRRTLSAVLLAFVISHTTFLAAQDDETGRCPKIGE